MIPVHHQLQPQILVEESRGMPVVQERQVPVLHQYVVEDQVRPVHHQIQQQYVVEENLRNSNFVNEFNRLEGNVESEQQRLLEKDSRIGKCLRWCVFLLPLIFFLICFIFCIVILSLLGQARNVHHIESSRAVLTGLGKNLEKRPYNDIISLPFETRDVFKCPQGYDHIPLHEFRGTRKGCYCDGKPSASYRCIGPNVISNCLVFEDGNVVHGYYDQESYLCGKRVSEFRRKEISAACPQNYKASGDNYCIPANEQELITHINIERYHHKTTSGTSPNQVTPPPVNGTGARILAQKYHRQNNAATGVVDPNLAQCFSRAEWINIVRVKEKLAICPRISRHGQKDVLSSSNAMVSLGSTVGVENSAPCVNPDTAPLTGNLAFTELNLKQRYIGCDPNFNYGDYLQLNNTYIPSGRTEAPAFFAANDLNAKINQISKVNTNLPANAYVNYYSERHHQIAPGCSNIRADKFNNLDLELNTWNRVITALTSVALALSIIGLLLSICYIVLKRVRFFRKPVIYAIVYVLAFIVAFLLIAQAIYYFVVRNEYGIFRNYRSLSHYTEKQCLSPPHSKAAYNFLHYIYEIVGRIAPFIIFLFAWSLFFIVVFLVCWVIGRIKRQAICNRPI